MADISVDEWEPLLLISDSGLWLGSSARSWVVGRRGMGAHAVDEDPRGLITFLERPWSIAKEELAEVEQRVERLGPIPTEPMMRMALGSATARWAELALNWLDDGYSSEGFADEISAIESKPGFPQKVRHLARRIRKSSS